MARQTRTLLVRILGIVGATECLIMWGFTLLGVPWGLLTGALDAILLTCCSAPLLYWWVIRPLAQEVSAAAVQMSEEEKNILAVSAEQTSDIVLITDSRGLIEYVNPAFERLTGYTRQEALGKTPRILKSGQHPREFYEEFWRTVRAGRSFHAVFMNRKKTGQLYYVEQTVTPVKDRDGRIIRLVSTGRDMTERRQMEEVLRQREAQYRLLVDGVNDGIAHTDTNGVIMFANRALARIHGLNDETDMIGHRVPEFIAPEDAERVADILQQLAVSNIVPETVTVQVMRPDGQRVHVEARSTAIIEGERMAGVLSVIRDMTQHKRIEDALRQQKESAERELHVMMGREERVLGLKHQVNDLLQELGRPPQYPVVK